MNDIRPHGLHHVTAIASDPQRNVDFYTRVLGLRGGRWASRSRDALARPRPRCRQPSASSGSAARARARSADDPCLRQKGPADSERPSQCPIWRPHGMSSGTNSSHIALHVDLARLASLPPAGPAVAFSQLVGSTAAAPGPWRNGFLPFHRAGAVSLLLALRPARRVSRPYSNPPRRRVPRRCGASATIVGICSGGSAANSRASTSPIWWKPTV